jgi:uncharacterized membrane-anchored protein
MIYSGRAVVDKRTKNLLRRIKPGQIAVILHKDLDELAAQEMVRLRVKAVINFDTSLSGTFYTGGPAILIKAGIPLMDAKADFNGIKEGDFIEIKNDGCIYVNNIFFCKAFPVNEQLIKLKENESKQNYCRELEKFAINTLDFIHREKYILSENFCFPELDVKLEGKHVLVVIRGKDYKEDLYTLSSYIDEMKPVLIGVDGGADVLLDFGLRPDIIIGDMDSISDRGLLCGAEIIVHAYTDGRAPGLERIKKKGLKYHILAIPGTSEDAALLLAYEKKANLIVAVGTHTNLIDFLEKGRHGMASTFLVRLKVGHILIDAKGVNKLYRSNIKMKYVAAVLFAAFFPLMVIGTTSPAFQHLIRLMVLQVKLMFGLL